MQHGATPEEVNSPYGQVGLHFSLALFNGQYDQAYTDLGSAIAEEWSPALLKEAYEDMIGYLDGPATAVSVDLVDMLDVEIVDKESDSIMVYISIVGDGDAEAVTVFVVYEQGRYVIEELEFGRP